MKKSVQLSVPIQQISGYASYLQEKLKIRLKDPNLDWVKQQLKKSWKDLRKIQKEDCAYRKQYLKDLAAFNFASKMSGMGSFVS